MSGFWPIFQRELASLWKTPLAWVLLCCFLLVQGGVFYSIVVHFSQMEGAPESGPMAAYFGEQSLLMALSLLLLCPPLTMRTLAEERRTGNVELLLSAPVTSAAIVLGKYSATLATYVAIWSPTLLYPATLRNTGELHVLSLASGYLGIFLIGAAYLAIGILMSSLARSQLIALLMTSAIIFGIFLIGVGEYIFEPGPLTELCAHVSLTSTLEEFAVGLVDTRRLILYLSMTAWALFVSTKVVESWRSP